MRNQQFARSRRSGWIRFRAASWQPEVVALATPIAVAGHPVYILNGSVNGSGIQEATQRLHAPLLQRAARLRDAISAL